MRPYRTQEIKLRLVRSRRATFTVNRSGHVAKAFADLSHEPRESLWGVFLNGANEVVCLDRLSTGTINSSLADPAEVIRSALLVASTRIILVHAHPSGLPTPSPQDRITTQDIVNAAALFKIQVLDHVIIGSHGRYYSFADEGALPKPDPSVGPS